MKKARARLRAMKPEAKSTGFIAKYMKALTIGTSHRLEDINNMTLL